MRLLFQFVELYGYSCWYYISGASLWIKSVCRSIPAAVPIAVGSEWVSARMYCDTPLPFHNYDDQLDRHDDNDAEHGTSGWGRDLPAASPTALVTVPEGMSQR